MTDAEVAAPDLELAHRVALSFAPEIGAARAQQLEQHFPSIADAWLADPRELSNAGLPRDAVAQIEAARARIDPLQELDRLRSMNVEPVTWHDSRYPPLLKQIYDPPPLLYVHGPLLPQDERAIAVVGTREPTAYGRHVTRGIVPALCDAGFTIVSGLALGVDAAAHRAALDAGGRTLAVVAGGLDKISPRSNIALAARIVETGAGAIISEHPLGIQPETAHFPRRNRILAGIALGALVTEAKINSGAWHTVNSALDHGREVFAVPGPVTSPQSAGANAMLQRGLAKLVAGPEDVLEEFPTQEDLQLPMPIADAAHGAAAGDITAASA